MHVGITCVCVRDYLMVPILCQVASFEGYSLEWGFLALRETHQLAFFPQRSYALRNTQTPRQILTHDVFNVRTYKAEIYTLPKREVNVRKFISALNLMLECCVCARVCVRDSPVLLEGSHCRDRACKASSLLSCVSVSRY